MVTECFRLSGKEEDEEEWLMMAAFIIKRNKYFRSSVQRGVHRPVVPGYDPEFIRHTAKVWIEYITKQVLSGYLNQLYPQLNR